MRLILAAMGLALLCGCGATAEEDSSTDLEEQHFQECMDAGGSYESEDTSAGNHWSCTVNGNKSEGNTP